MGTCIITGAGSGIGRETAIMLSKRNYYEKMALLGRNVSALQETKAAMSEESQVHLYSIDFNYPEQIPQVVETINEELGDLCGLLNIAGYTDPQSLLTTPYNSILTTYNINVFSPFMLIRESTRFMKQTGGKILNVASTAGMRPSPGWLSYSSSKAALISMSQTLAEELHEYGIKVYCVSPGRCATKLRQKLAPSEDPTTIMQPGEVAEVICNLLDEKEKCLDGQNLVIRRRT